MIKKYVCLLVLFPMLVLSCFHEVVVPVTINLSYTVKNDDYSIPVEITFDNKTLGAENYKWTFEGGEPSSSDSRNPGTISYSKGGIYTVILEAWNEDDRKTKEIQLQLFGAVKIDFETTIALNAISPVTVTAKNKTEGGTAYHWKFPDGVPESYTGYDPPPIHYMLAGDHTITLVVENGAEVSSLSHTIAVLPALVTDFTIEPSFADEDDEAPLTAALINTTIGGLTWQWSSTGGQLRNSTSQQSSIYFSSPGTYTITLTADNGKETKSLSKEIYVKPNSGLRTLKDIKLGINTAHSSIGSFYSTTLRRVIRQNDPDSLGKYIDLAFFGLNAAFTFNRFVSPDSVKEYTFTPIVQAQTTHFINSLEQCNCSVDFTETDFDQMITDEPLKAITIQSLANGLKTFDYTVIPRIILFRTSDDRKGAIKIKEFHTNGSQSYILIDIKVQKN